MFKAILEADFEALFFNAADTHRRAEAVADEAKKIIDRHFQVRQAAWKKLAAATMASRTKAGAAAGSILIQSGFLRKTASQSVTIETSERGATISIESGAAYSGIHEFGSGNIPARPFLEMSPGDLDQLTRDWLEKF